MTRAQKIWEERKEFFKSGNDRDSFLLYHKVCDLFVEHKFDPGIVKAKLDPSIGGRVVCISATGSETKLTDVEYALETLQLLVDRFSSEEHYCAYWVDAEGNCAGVTLEEAITNNATSVVVFMDNK